MRTEDFTQEEAKALRGTEFTYVMRDGDTIRAFVAEVDLNVGMTCKALSRTTDRDGYPLWYEEKGDDYDNIICVDVHSDLFLPDSIQGRLKELVDSGRITQSERSGSMQACAF
jgi:hypothetical protein